MNQLIVRIKRWRLRRKHAALLRELDRIEAATLAHMARIRIIKAHLIEIYVVIGPPPEPFES